MLVNILRLVIMKKSKHLYIADNRFEIAAGKNLDYENAARYVNCTFICNDGLHDSDHYTYELFVANANDAPEFDNTLYHVTIPEGAVSYASFPFFQTGSPFQRHMLTAQTQFRRRLCGV